MGVLAMNIRYKVPDDLFVCAPLLSYGLNMLATCARDLNMLFVRAFENSMKYCCYHGLNASALGYWLLPRPMIIPVILCNQETSV